MIMKRFMYIIGPILVVVMLIVAFLVSPYARGVSVLRKEPEKVSAYVLEIVPIGTDMDTAREIITERTFWEIIGIVDAQKYTSDANEISTLGERVMKVYLGEYGTFIKTSVIGIFGFDENDKLIDVGIKQEYDSL